MRRVVEVLKWFGVIVLWAAAGLTSNEVIQNTTGVCKAPRHVFGKKWATGIVILAGPFGTVFAWLRQMDYGYVPSDSR